MKRTGVCASVRLQAYVPREYHSLLIIANSHFVFRLVHAIGQCSRGGFVDDAQNLKAGDLSSVLGRLALRVIEVGRDSDNGIAYRLTQVRICKDNRR